MGLGINIKAELSTAIQLFTIQGCITNNTSGLFKEFLAYNDEKSQELWGIIREFLVSTNEPC
jgi:hypothetical protein